MGENPKDQSTPLMEEKNRMRTQTLLSAYNETKFFFMDKNLTQLSSAYQRVTPFISNVLTTISSTSSMSTRDDFENEFLMHERWGWNTGDYDQMPDLETSKNN